MDYFYHDCRLYPEGQSLSATEYVESDTLLCYDVRPVQPGGLAKHIQGERAEAWTFSVRGREGRFITHYNWALVLDTPENRRRLRDIEEDHTMIADLRQGIEKKWKMVKTASSVMARAAQ